MLEWGQLIFLAYIFPWSALKSVGQSDLPNSFTSIRRIGLNYGALLSTRKTWWTQKMFTYLVGQIFLERQPVKSTKTKFNFCHIFYSGFFIY